MAFKQTVLAAASSIALIVSATGASAQVEINFWHAMGGELGERTDEIVEGFNARQSEFKVNSVYRGNYTETMTAAIAGFRARQQPDTSKYPLI